MTHELEKEIKQKFDSWLDSEKEKINNSFEMYKYQHLVNSAKKLGYKLITEDEFIKLTEKSIYNKNTFDKDVQEKLKDHKQDLERQLNHELEKKDLLCKLEIVKLTECNKYLTKKIEDLHNLQNTETKPETKPETNPETNPETLI